MTLRGLAIPLLAALLPGLAASTASAPAVAQQGPAAQCIALADDTERLACYDAIFMHGGELSKDSIVISSERLIPALPNGRGPATMTLSCGPNGPVVAFAFAGQLVSSTSDIAPVTFQVDSNGTAVRTLAADAANTTLSFEAGAASRTFLDSLRGGANLKVRMTPVRQRSLTVDFRIQDHAEELTALRDTCAAG